MSSHTSRHSFAAHLLEDGADLRVIQVLRGHSEPEPTTICIKVATKQIRDVKNPLDLLVRRELGTG